MPRPRLTLGRLMAWIAFAAFNLWVLGAVYRRTRQSLGFVPVVSAAGVLALAYFTAYLACRVCGVYCAPPEGTTWFASGCLALIALGTTVIVLMALLTVLGFIVAQ